MASAALEQRVIGIRDCLRDGGLQRNYLSVLVRDSASDSLGTLASEGHRNGGEDSQLRTGRSLDSLRMQYAH
ncbi:hypothetical protein GCM10027562_28110 [Arthrobacter pigmenti]